MARTANLARMPGHSALRLPGNPALRAGMAVPFSTRANCTLKAALSISTGRATAVPVDEEETVHRSRLRHPVAVRVELAEPVERFSTAAARPSSTALSAGISRAMAAPVVMEVFPSLVSALPEGPEVPVAMEERSPGQAPPISSGAPARSTKPAVAPRAVLPVASVEGVAGEARCTATA